jgi:two-component system, response regulator PdtaR
MPNRIYAGCGPGKSLKSASIFGSQCLTELRLSAASRWFRFSELGEVYPVFNPQEARAGLIMKPIMLVVDDEPIVRMDLAGMAEEAGFQTVEAGSAADALAILETRDDIRAVFTDIRMPGDMDGLALAHLVRNRWPPTVIVICSGNTPPAANELPSNVQFLKKPCNGTQTAKLLSSILEQIG